MRPSFKWASLPVSAVVGISGFTVLGLLILPQMIAVMLTAPERSSGESELSIFEVIGLWGQADPTVVTGSAMPGQLHWVLAVLPLALIVLGFVLLARHNQQRKKNPQLKEGLAPVKDVVKELGKKQLLENGARLRPSVDPKKLDCGDVGYLIGNFLGIDAWLRIEDPMIVIGPSRSGKGWNIVLNWIMNAPGAVITTSSKTDNAALTMEARKKTSAGGKRDVWIFAPGDDSAEGLGHNLRWDPIVGCVDEKTLLRRVKALIPSGSFSGSTSNGGHWDTLGQQLASHLFHAAACAGGDVDMVWGWVVSPQRAMGAVEAIRQHPNGLLEHASHLQEVIEQPAEQRASSWGTLHTVLAFMESRSAREWMKPAPDQNFSIPKFVMEKETIYLVGDKNQSPAYTTIVDGLLAELDYGTISIAKAMGGRLDPPVTYLLDEAANFNYQGLSELITAGGGLGRVGVAIFQSKSQLGEYGERAQKTLWDAAAAKIILPGSADSDTLKEMQQLVGEMWVTRESYTHGHGDPSIQISRNRESVLEATDIREMEKTHCLLFYRNLKPVIVKMNPFHKHPRFEECIATSKGKTAAVAATSEFAEALKVYQKG